MMPATCHNLEFGRTAFVDFVPCGCSFSSSFDRFPSRNYARKVIRSVNRGFYGGGGGRNSIFCRRDGNIAKCRVFSTEAPETLLNGDAPGPPPVINEKKESTTDLFEAVSDDLLTLNKNLQSIVGAENPVLMAAAEQIFSAGGKRMRPALVFLVSRATSALAGLEELTREHRRLAEIIEMIHTASLIHDDVLDESDMRRGQETVHQMYGTRVAVLAGDFMFAQSSWYLANLENLEVIKLISQVIKDFASGEIKQASSLFDCDVKLDEYLIKSYYKTASLIAASTKGAAIFSGVSNDVSEQMYQYGKNLGLSFQVVDDILDFTQSAEQLGTIAANRNLTDGQTVISDDETFKMGFFSPTNNSTNRYFGIWYNKISVMTVVWVANRETPLTDTSGVLLLRDNGTLTLLNRTNNAIWSSNSSESGNNPVAKLLDTGNLVITNDGDRNLENYLWQSFDYPGNTFLPTMKFGIDYVRGLNKYLTAWKSDNDPSSGEYTNRFDSEGYPQIILRKGSEVVFNSGPWNGLRFSGMPNLKPNDIYTFGFELNSKELYYKYELVNNFTISRMILSTDGVIQRWIWIDRTQQWSLYLSAQMDNCDRFGLCGPYGVCNINNSPACGCLRGFVPRFPEEWRRADWSNGCMRKADLACDGVAAASGDGFVQMTGVKLPDTRKTWFNVSMGIEECGRVCLRDCNCTAYANIDVRTGSGCLIWLDDLVDIRVYGEGGQDVHVKMAASELHRRAEAKRKVRIIVIPVLVGFAVLLGLSLIVFYRRRRWHKKNGVPNLVRETNFGNENEREDWELPIFDFNTIAIATKNFSEECLLGEGGYGPVYKGMLEEGKEIAVKRHSRKSKQGLDEFQNEVTCIAKLQHRNLVRLLGCCIEQDERMLIYEYMPNKSLNSFIFEGRHRKSLDWSKRYNIIIGIARGLLYLHQDSRLRIIHRDLKASNILLDKEMNPRISDFGLARSMEGSKTQANTRRVMGTYGYMAPEYTIDGIYSTKSDVFSFGVLVLEIVSGKKNRGFRHANHDLNLLGHAWRLYRNGKQLELIDDTIKGSYVQSQVNRAIHIGLLCVQKYPEDRPDMPLVVVMLGSQIPLPEPKQPGFYTERRRPQEADSSSSNHEWSSSNHISVTYLEPR